MEHSFGTWVKRRRKALDLTREELAQRVGCSVSLIFKIESDERRPSRQVAELLSHHLEIPTGQRDLFLKVARQAKAVDALDDLPPPADPAPVPVSPSLPIPLTSLLGREHEVRAILQQMQDPACRLLTLTGPGGIGKTRLALEVARQLEDSFADGVFFLSMVEVASPDSILPNLAETLGIAFSGPADPKLQVVNHLRAKRILLVFDNFEHILAGGQLLGDILRQAPGVKMILTSREQIHLQWEWVFEVQGLPIPESVGPDLLRSNSAAALFLERARQTARTFALADEDIPELARICRLVDGMPLALELAASWVRVLSCREIARELERGLDFLETKKLDVPARHRSIRAVFDHSWKLLTGDEQTLLKRLSVFQGGFTREAAFHVAEATLPLLSSLVDKSLLRHSPQADRYDLHELIRQYAFAQLQADPTEEMSASEKYAAYFAQWIAGLEASFKSPLQPQTSALIHAETRNWHAGWQWAVNHQRLDFMRKMSPCLNWYFEVHGFYGEALSTFKSALELFRARGAPDGLHRPAERSAFAGLVDQVGWFEFRTGNVERGAALLAESMELAREFDDPEILYYIYGNWGYLCLMAGDQAEAGRLTAESLRYGKLLTPWHTAIPISVLGIVAYQQGNLLEARHQLTESLKIWRTVGDPRGLVFCMLYLGMTTFALNDMAATRSILEESNAIAEANMDRWAHAFGLDMLGQVNNAEGRLEAARDLFRQSLAFSREIGDQWSATQTLIHLADAQATLEADSDARRLFIEAYADASQSRWTPTILEVLVAFLSFDEACTPEQRLAAILSVLSHASLSPHVRARAGRLRDDLSSRLPPEVVERAAGLASEKSPEAWAREILQSG